MEKVTRQSKCDSPLRGQSHLLCLVTAQRFGMVRAKMVQYGSFETDF